MLTFQGHTYYRSWITELEPRPPLKIIFFSGQILINWSYDKFPYRNARTIKPWSHNHFCNNFSYVIRFYWWRVNQKRYNLYFKTTLFQDTQITWSKRGVRKQKIKTESEYELVRLCVCVGPVSFLNVLIFQYFTTFLKTLLKSYAIKSSASTTKYYISFLNNQAKNSI